MFLRFTLPGCIGVHEFCLTCFSDTHWRHVAS
uniref:Uncharacterized protein n=1 Tax=Arundo donax TaxID=35708 RepID=A0A0A9AG19_ARUDO